LSYSHIVLYCPSESNPKGPRLRGRAYAYEDASQKTGLKRATSALHLPETSRQIYNETTTLAHRLNIFCMTTPLLTWQGDLFCTSAHRLAIQTLQIRDYELDRLACDLRNGQATVFNKLVGLRRLRIVFTHRPEEWSYSHQLWLPYSRAQFKIAMQKHKAGDCLEMVWARYEELEWDGEAELKPIVPVDDGYNAPLVL
jgi:hypothetical protein